MIFVTVGTQLPFDRLIDAVDAWAGAAPGREVFAQVGPTRSGRGTSSYAPFMSPAECREKHASGDRRSWPTPAWGTILSALELGKPLLIMPRQASLGEHRNDHQLATAERFAAIGRVTVAEDEAALLGRLDELDALRVARADQPVRLAGAARADPGVHRGLRRAPRDHGPPRGHQLTKVRGRRGALTSQGPGRGSTRGPPGRTLPMYQVSDSTALLRGHSRLLRGPPRGAPAVPRRSCCSA